MERLVEMLNTFDFYSSSPRQNTWFESVQAYMWLLFKTSQFRNIISWLFLPFAFHFKYEYQQRL